jgi:hypothetical protein
LTDIYRNVGSPLLGIGGEIRFPVKSVRYVDLLCQEGIGRLALSRYEFPHKPRQTVGKSAESGYLMDKSPLRGLYIKIS